MVDSYPIQPKHLRKCGISLCGFCNDPLPRPDSREERRSSILCSYAQANTKAHTKPEKMPEIEKLQRGSACKYGLEALEKLEVPVQVYPTREIPSAREVAQSSPSATPEQKRSILNRFFEVCRREYARIEAHSDVDDLLLRNRPPTG